MNTFDKTLGWLNEVWGFELFSLGGSEFTTKTFFFLILYVSLLFFFTSMIRKLLVKRIFPRYKIDIGVGQSIATIIRYTLLIVGIVVIVQTTGIDLSAIGLLVGALGVGIGFGLQSITNNFISGIIILFERPVKVGDRIEIEKLAGNIISISARATTIITNDNIAVIVPNSDIINTRVINWSLNNKSVKLNFHIGVSYKEDPEIVRALLIEIANDNPGVLKEPKINVLFDDLPKAVSNLFFKYELSNIVIRQVC